VGTEIAVLGTGVMGLPMARRLAEHEYAVRAWNRTRAKAEALAAHGVTIATTPADAVTGADVVMTVLKDGATVAEVVDSAGPALRPGAVWIQASTVGVPAIDDLAARAKHLGVTLFDAPVQGTKGPAEQGSLVVLASGPPVQRPLVQPIFDVIGARTVWVSDRPGESSRLKLALNILVLAATHGTAEALSLASALGVDPATLVEVVTGGPLDSGLFQAKAAAMLTGDFSTTFSVANALKDTKLVVDAASAAGVRLDVTSAGAERFRRAIEKGHAGDDMAASIAAA
jgi:3-hydroxyisobutyrate dehydrogenase